jgi:hypothetical protein
MTGANLSTRAHYNLKKNTIECWWRISPWLRGENIPITARIFAVADVVDALMSHRPYNKPLTV